MRGARTEGVRRVATTMSPFRRTTSVRAFPNPEDAPVTVVHGVCVSVSQYFDGLGTHRARLLEGT